MSSQGRSLLTNKTSTKRNNNMFYWHVISMSVRRRHCVKLNIGMQFVQKAIYDTVLEIESCCGFTYLFLCDCRQGIRVVEPGETKEYFFRRCVDKSAKREKKENKPGQLYNKVPLEKLA